MKRLLLLGTIAAVTLTTTGQAQSLDEQRRVVRRVAPKHSVKTERATVTRPSTNRTVVRRSINGGSPNYHSGYYPYYYGGGPSVSIGIGGGYGYPGYYGYGYGYGYPRAVVYAGPRYYHHRRYYRYHRPYRTLRYY